MSYVVEDNVSSKTSRISIKPPTETANQHLRDHRHGVNNLFRRDARYRMVGLCGEPNLQTIGLDVRCFLRGMLSEISVRSPAHGRRSETMFLSETDAIVSAITNP